jgi:hypothetical protein
MFPGVFGGDWGPAHPDWGPARPDWGPARPRGMRAEGLRKGPDHPGWIGLIMVGALLGAPFWTAYLFLAVAVTISLYRHFDLPPHRSPRRR